MRPGLALRVALRLCGLLTVCVAQVSPSSAQKLADCLTVSELDELSDSLPLIYNLQHLPRKPTRLRLVPLPDEWQEITTQKVALLHARYSWRRVHRRFMTRALRVKTR